MPRPRASNEQGAAHAIHHQTGTITASSGGVYDELDATTAALERDGKKVELQILEERLRQLRTANAQDKWKQWITPTTNTIASFGS